MTGAGESPARATTQDRKNRPQGPNPQKTTKKQLKESEKDAATYLNRRGKIPQTQGLPSPVPEYKRCTENRTGMQKKKKPR